MANVVTPKYLNAYFYTEEISGALESNGALRSGNSLVDVIVIPSCQMDIGHNGMVFFGNETSNAFWQLMSPIQVKKSDVQKILQAYNSTYIDRPWACTVEFMEKMKKAILKTDLFGGRPYKERPVGCDVGDLTVVRN